MTELRISDRGERENLGTFIAYAVRMDGNTVVRLRTRSPGVVEAWVATVFDVLVMRAAEGEVTPQDVSVSGNDLLAALTVATDQQMNPGPSQDLLWQSELPVTGQWRFVDDVPVTVVADLAERGVTLARENVGPYGTPPASLMDQTVLTVSNDDLRVEIPMRCLLAMSSMGFVDSSRGDDTVRVTATDSWLRLDARYGAVLRRRQSLLPLFVVS